MTDETRTDRRAVVAGLCLAALGTVVLGGCGRKGPPTPPSGGDTPYPRTYPEGATPDPDEQDREL